MNEKLCPHPIPRTDLKYILALIETMKGELEYLTKCVEECQEYWDHEIIESLPEMY